MRLFVAEDEAPARERLLEAIARVAPQARVEGTAGSVREARAWLATHPAPDLLLLDIQLSDGLSLELFGEGSPRVDVPVVFTTAYDEFVLEAFRAQAVDYLLKPVDEARLAQAFDKRERLQRHFGDGLAALLQRLQPAPRYRSRIVGRQGARHVAVPVERAACFVSVDKLSYLVTDEGERCLLDAPLAELERELDPAMFFRANRQCVLNARAVVGFRPGGRGRLRVSLAPATLGEVEVSQERAAAFRAWLSA